MQRVDQQLAEMGVGAAPAPGPRIARSPTRTIVKTPGESKSARRLARNAAKRERRMVCLAEED